MKAILLLISLHCATILYAQDFQWALTLGGIENEDINDMAVDEAGNLYVCGSYRVEMELGPSVVLSASGINDGFVAKYDSNGELIWAKSIGGNGNDACNSLDIDDEGNVVLAGFFSNTVDLNTDAGIQNFTSNGSTDIFVIKLTSSGGFISAISFGGTGGDSVLQLKVDSNNDWILSGLFFNTVDFNPGAGVNNITSNQGAFADRYILKLTSSGIFQWVKNMNSRLVNMNDLVIDESNSIYIGGSFTNTVDFNPDAGISNLTAQSLSSVTSDGFILKLNSSGTYQWAKDVGSTGNDYVYAIDIDSNNDLIITGTFSGQVTFTPGVTIDESENGSAFISKILSDGSLIWARSFGGNPTEIAVNDDNSIFICGFLFEEEDADPGILIFPLNSVGNNDILLSRYDQFGNLSWAYSYGGSGFDRPLKLLKSPTNELYVSGNFDGITDLNPSAIENTYQSNGQIDVFVQKFGLCSLPAAAGLIEGPSQLCALQTYSYSIEPADGAEFYTWFLSGSLGFIIDSATTEISYQAITLGESELFVRAQNSCGFGTPASLEVTTLLNGTVSASSNSSGNICSGETVSLSLTGSNNTITSWLNDYQSGVPIALTETTTFYAQGVYTNGCITYDTLVIVVNETPVITAEIIPGNSVCSGTNVTITASGANNFTFSNGITNGNSFVAETSQQITITGISGSCSANAEINLVVNMLPEILQNPADQAVITGNSTSFSVECIDPDVSFQWQVNSGNGFEDIIDNTPPYSGSLSSMLSITNTDIALNESIFRCYISNNECGVFSESATLTVSTTVGFMLNSESTINVYPNPASNIIYFNLTNNNDIPKFDLYDLQGRKVSAYHVLDLNSIDISMLSAGWYLIKYQDLSQPGIRFFKE